MNKQRAFTLIELMIVVTILAILAAVGYPLYTKQIQKGHRSDAQQLMLDASNKEEQYITAARQYTASFTDLGITKDGWTCTATSCSNNFYDIVITPVNTSAPPTYSIKATAKGTQVDDGDITLDSSGARTLNGSSGW